MARKDKDFIFYKVVKSVDKGHSHYSFSLRLFYDVEKAKRFARKQPQGTVQILKIKTFASGELKLSVLKF